MFSTLPIKEIALTPPPGAHTDVWPYNVPSVRFLTKHGLQLSQATVIVGENGAGKSVLIESIAEAFGFPLGGGTTWEQRGSVEGASAFGEYLSLARGISRGGGGLFFRAETVYGLVEYLDGVGSERAQKLLKRSHGESALELMSQRVGRGGLWIFDEPESGLSFSGQIKLLALIQSHLDDGGQVILCTHSPLLMSLPEADLLEIGEWGIRGVDWEDLETVNHWLSFLQSPTRYLRHLR